MQQNCKIAIGKANDIVTNTNTADFRVQSFNSADLLIVGSFDLAYYHEIELWFHGVVYINLPTEGLCSPRFEIADSKTRTAYSFLELNETDMLFRIVNDPEFSGQEYFVAAENMTLREGMVYHYQREDLKEGERIAPWVKPISNTT